MTYIPVLSTGQDQTAQFRAAWMQAAEGDTIQLIPQYGKPFVLSQTVEWLSANKTIHVEATGAQFQGTATVLPNPLIAFGAPAGARSQNGLHWRGGFFWGNFALNNLSYATVDLDRIYHGGLVINTDDVSAYLKIGCRGGITSNGTQPSITLNQANANAWANEITFDGIPCLGAGLNTGMPIVSATNPNAPEPGLWTFDDCTFEVTEAVNLFSGNLWQAYFHNCWFEGAISLGNLGADSCLIFSAMRGNVSWLNDPRAVIVSPAIP